MGHRLPTIGWKIQTRAGPEEKNKSDMKKKIICAEESDLPPCWRHSYIHRSWQHLTDPHSHFWAVLFGHWGHTGLGAPRLAQATWVSRSWGPVTSPECTWYTSTTFYMHASAWYISPTASSARLVERGRQWWATQRQHLSLASAGWGPSPTYSLSGLVLCMLVWPVVMTWLFSSQRWYWRDVQLCRLCWRFIFGRVI